jgi:hypothetical protein
MTRAIEAEAGNSSRAIPSRFDAARARFAARKPRCGRHGEAWTRARALLLFPGMPTKIRINLANEQELRELPGIGAPEAAAIVRFRAEHGPITDAAALARVLGNRPLADALGARADFAPADSTAPEAPGA